ncbi:Uncharacterised protein [Vibrio cholerae]|nr:Uncharacterised protein [Vibrio cholerae]
MRKRLVGKWYALVRSCMAKPHPFVIRDKAYLAD